MKYLFIILTCLALGSGGCSKDGDTTNCEPVTITQTGMPCSVWGIKVGTTTYPSMNIPDEFKQENRSVCAVYELYEDLRMCACCGGTWADIKSMRFFTR